MFLLMLNFLVISVCTISCITVDNGQDHLIDFRHIAKDCLGYTFYPLLAFSTSWRIDANMPTCF